MPERSVVDGDVLAGADVVLTVNSLDVDRVSALTRGTVVVSFLAPVQSLDKVKAAQQSGVDAGCRWSWCPASRAHSRWTRCPRRVWLPATAAPWWLPNGYPSSFRC